MKTLITDISSLVTVSRSGDNYKTGQNMNDIGEIRDGAFLFSETIEWVGTAEEARKKIEREEIWPDKIVHAKGKTVLPGFVDSHTHFVFAGNRTDEFAHRLRGATYQEIAEAGGGIKATVKATRNAGVDELFNNAMMLALSAMKHGTTTMEIKSGYGLDFQSEMNQLYAIKKLKETLPVEIRTTFLGAHDFPPEYADTRDDYVTLICEEMLPAVAEEGLADYCDAFVDKGYYTIEQGRRIFETAIDLGLKIKMHADELADVDAAALAVEVGAVSADHLLFVSDKNIDKMKESGTIACLLPGTAYFIRMPYAPARRIIDKGAIVALATDCNPGSSYTENMQTILSLAAINMKMTAEESITAATLNAAHSLELSDKVGSIEPGKNADFLIADVSSYAEIFYHFGINHIEETWIKGKKV
jgi:imidazolonepropionase